MARPPAPALLFNRLALRVSGRRALPLYAVLHHRGRRSGREYRTPVAVLVTPASFVVAMAWGPDADWVRNVLAAGEADVTWRGRRYACPEVDVVDEDVALAAAKPWQRALLRRAAPSGYVRLTHAPSG